MINLTINDSTQNRILNHLKETEILLSKVETNLSKELKEVCVYTMPDLMLKG